METLPLIHESDPEVTDRLHPQKKETRGRPKKVKVVCENIRKASFTDEKGRRIKPGETAEVSQKFAKQLVANKVARYESDQDGE